MSTDVKQSDTLRLPPGLLPKNIADLSAYSSAKSEKLSGSTWLNANESPYTREYKLSGQALNRYPDPQPQQVIQAYADYVGLAPEQVVMTRGADEGIELLVRTFCQSAKDSIAIFAPTYGMYKVTADTHNVALNTLSQELLLQGDVDEICTQVGDAKLVFICNPNNPTGALVSQDKIAAIAARLTSSALVVVDEAYIEFCPEQSAVSLLADYANVVVLRTLSKAFALAGLRTGFTLANTQVLAPLRKVLAPYPVSTVVADITAQALSTSNIASMRRQVDILNALKSRLQQWLEQSDAVTRVLKGKGNFVTLQLKDKNAIAIAYQQGLVMRPFTLYGQDNWLRISIGNEQELGEVKAWLDSLTGSTATNQ
ncbi:histidinol-phosphate transaminase [Pseudoalteromonas sp. YIC-827]|uniref:histidinol-phosphate transaminase n=1 Tax=Pseudoalteromonas qingdaonensis TaxID=3131913 RepID=A0ABU9MZK1_9GAMM